MCELAANKNMNYKTKSQWAAEGRTVESAAVIGAPLNEDGEPVFPESSTYVEPIYFWDKLNKQFDSAENGGMVGV